jgi:hypothetical protein
VPQFWISEMSGFLGQGHIKAELNKKANYDVGQVLANARAFAAQFHDPDGRVRVQSN